LKLIANRKTLVRTLSRLIENHSEAAFAVAWASSGNQVSDLLKENSSRIIRAVIGTHFYQTHPDVLDTFNVPTRSMSPFGVTH